MIRCNNITKTYEKCVVLDNFTYTFSDNGFYLLLGESGSGKTTFINLLSGLVNKDDGEFYIDNKEYSNEELREYMRRNSDYITQDAFFVDFLDVRDNLKMVCDDDELIKQKLDEFGILEKISQFPSSLSGGEKQRLSIVRALLGNKKILMLDEPTASLDSENKKIIFEYLRSIKDNVLIVCSSHDREAVEYADYVIEFKKEHKILDEDITDAVDVKKNDIVRKKAIFASSDKIQNNKKRRSAYFLKKWFHSGRRSKKSNIMFGIFLTLAMCLCLLADTPQNRLDSNMEYTYNINMCRLLTHNEDVNEYTELKEEVGEVVLDYGWSLPTSQPTNGDDSLYYEIEDYETSVSVLPFSEKYCKVADNIKYGTYFTSENQIILSYEMAKKLMPDNPENLIGKTLTKKFYGIGEVDLEIVGIFDYFDDFEKMYLKAMGINIHTGDSYDEDDYTDLWFANAKFVEKFASDESFFSTDGQRVYTLFFDSYKEMKEYYKTHKELYNQGENWIYIGITQNDFLGVFKLMYNVLLPLSYFLVLFTTLFYINLIRTELTYNNKFISVFDYAGYNSAHVSKAFTLLSLSETIKIFFVSVVFTVVISTVANIINKKYVFIKFQPFSYNVYIIAIFVCILLSASVLFTGLTLRRYRKVSWYDNILNNRDLI